MIIRQSLSRQSHQLASAAQKTWTRSYASQLDLAEPRIGLEETGIRGHHEEDVQARLASKPPGPSHASTPARLQRHKVLQHAGIRKAKLGSIFTPHYKPHMQYTHPPSPDEVSISMLHAAQAWMGHSTSLWNPLNSRYILGVRQGIHVIAVEQTAAHLRRACRVVSGVAEAGGLILFVGTRAGHERIVVRAAELAGACHLFSRWIPGAITNGAQILRHCEVKALDQFDREIPGLSEELGEKAPVLKPDLVVCLNPTDNWVLLHECALNAIPTVGIIDTDANPTWVTYPIPANDDSLRSVNLIAGALGKAGEEGRERRRAKAMEGQATYEGFNLESIRFKE